MGNGKVAAGDAVVVQEERRALSPKHTKGNQTTIENDEEKGLERKGDSKQENEHSDDDAEGLKQNKVTQTGGDKAKDDSRDSSCSSDEEKKNRQRDFGEFKADEASEDDDESEARGDDEVIDEKGNGKPTSGVKHIPAPHSPNFPFFPPMYAAPPAPYFSPQTFAVPEEAPSDNYHRKPPRSRTKHSGGVVEPFPLKLHRMLETCEREGLSDVASFFSHGRAFAIHKPRRFVEYVMPRFFKQTKLTSFQRQLNLYGFKRLTTGPDNGKLRKEIKPHFLFFCLDVTHMQSSLFNLIRGILASTVGHTIYCNFLV